MNELERALIPVKFVSQNIEKQKSQRCLAVPQKKTVFFDIMIVVGDGTLRWRC